MSGNISDTNIFRFITIFDAPYYLTDDGSLRWLKISNAHLNDLKEILSPGMEIHVKPDAAQPHIQSLVRITVIDVEPISTTFLELGVIVNWHRLNPIYDELKESGITKRAKEWKTVVD